MEENHICDTATQEKKWNRLLQMRRNNHSIAKKTPQKTTEKDDDPRIPGREI